MLRWTHPHVHLPWQQSRDIVRTRRLAISTAGAQEFRRDVTLRQKSRHFLPLRIFVLLHIGLFFYTTPISYRFTSVQQTINVGEICVSNTFTCNDLWCKWSSQSKTPFTKFRWFISPSRLPPNSELWFMKINQYIGNWVWKRAAKSLSTAPSR